VEPISFARGVPAPECVPAAELAECAHAAIALDAPALLAYGVPGGFAPLREAIAARHSVGPDRVLVTAGSLQAFALVAQHLLAVRPGRVLVEGPTYDRPLALLEMLGAEVVAVPIDREGLHVDTLADQLRRGPRPSFLYTIPTFQNPSGVSLSAERRRRLTELAAEHDLFVYEDDPYGLVRFDGQPLPSLLSLDDGGRVVYASSFSKIVAPGLRVGYVVLPPSLVAPVERLAASTYISPAPLTQATVFEFLRRGLLGANVARVRSLLRARRDAMLEALGRAMPHADWTSPEGGYFVWLELPGGADAERAHDAAARAGVAVVRGADFFPGGEGGRSGLRLAFSYASPDEIAEGITRLASVVPLRAAA
jgi:2-aminoadipate transaminase